MTDSTRQAAKERWRRESHARWADAHFIDYPLSPEEYAENGWEQRMRALIRIITGREPGVIVATRTDCTLNCLTDEAEHEMRDNDSPTEGEDEPHVNVVIMLGGTAQVVN